MLNAFTVDVEDYYHVSGFERDISRADWPKFESRVMANVGRLLDLLARHNVRATFFVLGWVADHYPEVVREIDSADHEIGSHGYWHRLIYNQTPDEFRDDIRRSKAVLQDLTSQPITAYRAPSFSVRQDSLWALEVLIEEGFTLDSSIFPTRRRRYGIPDAEPAIHRITTPSGDIWEFPPAVVRFAGVNVPVSGGGYFRLKPWQVTRRLLTHVNNHYNRPFTFYVHPWEVDPRQPRMTCSSRADRFRHYVNLASTEGKLDRLLARFPFGTMTHAVDWFAQAVPISAVAYATA